MKKLLCVLLTVALLIVSAGAAAADETGKKQENKSIAIVFDNSGSMYGQEAWCRATYAMEVFASMMNEDDTMIIYPMHQIKIGATAYTSDKPLRLNGPKDAQIIREIFTPNAFNTPMETIDKAFNGLMQESGERWMIVLTDGDQFNGYDNQQTVVKLEEKLSDYIRDVNIMYLGIGKNPAMPDVKGGSFIYFKDQASDSVQVLSKLSHMCNLIFGRDTMEIPGDEVDISDLSMRKMIFLVQGKEISDVSVTDSSGKPIGDLRDQRDMKYSIYGSNKGNLVDKNLQGMMVIFENCSAGNYRIRFKGDADSIVAYYEPDVDLVVQLYNDATGSVIMGNEQAFSGSYTLRYGLKDNQTNELTESRWLGNTHYLVEYTINGKAFTAESNQKRDALQLTLNGGDVVEAKISADYLSGYHLEKYGPDFGWPENGFHIVPSKIDATKLVFEVSGGESEYLLSRLEEQGHYFIRASFDGQPLTGEHLAAYQPIVSLAGGNAEVQTAPAADGSGYDVFLKYHEDALHTSVGEYTLSCNVLYTDANGLSCTGKDLEIPFTLIGEEHALVLDVTAKQAYYQISKLDVGEPIVVNILKDGAALTDQQISALQLDIDSDGIAYDSRLLPGESAIEIRLKRTDDLKTGMHRIRVTATGTDEIGQTMQAEDSTVVEIQTLPAWVRWAIIIAALLLLALLVFLFLNQKVLPKSVKCNGETDFNIGGKTIEDNARLQYNRAGKTLDLSAPAAPAYPYVSCAAKLRLEPVSPRRVPSAKRKMAVKEVSASSDITSVEVGASVYELDKATGKFVKEGSSQTVLSNNSVISINGTAQTSNGRKKTAILSQQLRFK